jgi:hypothetical protein
MLILAATAVADATFGLRSNYGFTDIERAGEEFDLDYLVDRFNPGFLVGFDSETWGMTFDFGFAFTSGEGLVPELDESWQMNFDYSAAFDVHLLPGSRILAPYVGVNAGFGLEADVTNYEEVGYPEDYSPVGDDGLTSFAFQGGVHAGLRLELGAFFVNARLNAALLDAPIPVAGVDRYERSALTLMLAVGMLL